MKKIRLKNNRLKDILTALMILLLSEMSTITPLNRPSNTAGRYMENKSAALAVLDCISLTTQIISAKFKALYESWTRIWFSQRFKNPRFLKTEAMELRLSINGISTYYIPTVQKAKKF